MSFPYSRLLYQRRLITPRSPKPTPFLVIPLFIAPFLALSIITLDLPPLKNNHNHLLPVRSRTLYALAEPHPSHLHHRSVSTNPPLPENGFPPATLPPTHPNFHLLNNIRNSCHITPRWPNHPRMRAAQLRTYGPAYSSIIISDKLKLVYIPVFKVATTTMMWHIAYLENNPHVLNNMFDTTGALDLVLHEMSSNAWNNHTIYNTTTEHIQRVFEDPSYLKFGFVRNPFDRIISAYLDKIVSWPIHSEEYQKQMWSLYGNDFIKRAEANVSKPSFPDYLQEVAKVLHMPRTTTTDLQDINAYEDNTSRRDMHWRPQVELLHPDLIHLDFVGRFENIENDRDIVLQWMYRHTNRRMPVQAETKMHATDPRDKVQLLEMLRHDEPLRQLVLETYRQDFDTFHFSHRVPDA